METSNHATVDGYHGCDLESPTPPSMGAGTMQATKKSPVKGWRFWAVFPALCVTTMLAAVESSVTSTALPFIVHELDAGDLYVWFVNAYFLTR